MTITDSRILKCKEKYENNIYYNTFGTQFKVLQYNRNDNVLIEFQDDYKYQKTTDIKSILSGYVLNPYDKSIFGVGYYGNDRRIKETNDEYNRCYSIWHHMLKRCYEEDYLWHQKYYSDCSVCSEWHNLQNFYKWYKENIITLSDKNERVCLDKDILVKNNRIYSPQTCCFVPNEINVLFTKTSAKRGDYPIGVYYKNKNHKFCAQCKIGGGKPQKYLGLFDTPQEAFEAYKNFKEQYIKQVADKYKGQIADNVYQALYAYEVDIND